MFDSTKNYLQPIAKSTLNHSVEGVILIAAVGTIAMTIKGVLFGYGKVKQKLAVHRLERQLAATATIPSPYGVEPAAAE